jgi:arsenate reductase
VIEYLVTPPSKNELIQMIADAGLTVREAIRKNVAPYTELGIDQEDWTEDQLLNFMLQYPILINRPFVVTELGTRLSRPSELVLEILPLPQKGAFTKEDGEQVLDANGLRLK